MVLKHAIVALAVVLCSRLASSDAGKCGKFEMLIPHQPECERTCFNQCPLRSKRRVLIARPTCVCLPGYVRSCGECVPVSYCEKPEPPCPPRPTPCPPITTPCPPATTPCPPATTPCPPATTPCPCEPTTTPCRPSTTPSPCECTTTCRPCNSCGSPCKKKSRCSCNSCPKSRPVLVGYY